jgi:hypothetical protein
MRNTLKNKRLLSKREIDKLKSEVLSHKRIALFKELQLSRLNKEIKKFDSETQEPQPERRYTKRIDVFLFGEIILGGKKFLALIDNISLNGIYYKISSCNSCEDIPVGQVYELTFKLPSGETLNHTCSVKWLCKALPHKVFTCVGSEIMNPTQKYKEFIGSLFNPGENI